MWQNELTYPAAGRRAESVDGGLSWASTRHVTGTPMRYDEQHCQTCHIGHAAIPQPAAQVAVLAARSDRSFAAADEFRDPHFDSSYPSIPRAPPA